MIGARAHNGVGLSVYLEDHFTRKADRINARMETMYGNAQRVQRANLSAMRNAGLALAGTGILVSRQFARWVKDGMEFRHTMKGVQAVTSATTDELKKLSEKALQLGGETVFTIEDVAGGMYYLAKAGFKPQGINQTIDAVTALGAATDTKIGGKGGAADQMTNLMTSFNKTGAESKRMASILAVATNNANVSLTDLHESFKYSANEFRSLKIPFEDAAAAVATIGNMGLHASIGGTAMSNMLRKLVAAMGEFRTDKQSRAFQLLGLTGEDLIDQQTGRMKRLVDILDMMRGQFNKMGDVQALNVLQWLTGVRGSRGMGALLTQVRMNKGFREMADLLHNVKEEEAWTIAADKMDTLHGDTLKLNSAWSEFKVRFTDALTPMLRGLAKNVASLLKSVNAFVATDFGKFVIKAAVGMTAMVTAAGALLAAFGGLGLMIQGSAVSMKALRATTVWAFNSMSAAAMRFGIIQRLADSPGIGRGLLGKTALRTGKGGRFFKVLPTGMHRFVKKDVAARYMQRFGATPGMRLNYVFGKLAKTGMSVLKFFGRFSKGLSIVGGVSLMLEASGISLKEQFTYLVSTIKWVIGELTIAASQLLKYLSFGTIDLTRGKTWGEQREYMLKEVWGDASEFGLERSRKMVESEAWQGMMAEDYLGRGRMAERFGASIPEVKEKPKIERKGDVIINVNNTEVLRKDIQSFFNEAEDNLSLQP